MVGAKPFSYPTTSSPKLSFENSKLLSDPSEYRRVVVLLQYCTILHPDIAYGVNQLCQFMQNPCEPHWIVIKHVLRYLKGSIDYNLYFTLNAINLQVSCDFDWAGNLDDHWSTAGYGIFPRQNLITWIAKKQLIVSKSSTEAEYHSLAITTIEIYWIQMLMKELGLLLPSTLTIWHDSIGAIALASNPVFHAWTKYVEVDYHFIREKVLDKDIQVKHIYTQY